jgi:hypothetical protein
MKSKVVINIQDGLLEVTGSEKFVKSIYDDFKDKLANYDDVKPIKQKIKKKESTSSSRSNKLATGSKIKKQTASVNINSDIQVEGLEAFYSDFDPKTDAEKALIFVYFLREKRDLSPCSVSDIHTCFFAMKEHLNVPSNYRSLLKNDAQRTKYFDRNGSNEITITSIGENHFNHKLKRKSKD